MDAIAQYPASYVRALLDVASEHGVAAETLLDHAGLSAAIFEQAGAWIEQPKLLMMFQAATLLSGVDEIGLEVGKHVHPGLFSALGYALKSCRNLAEAMQVSQQYQPVVMGQGAVSLEDRGAHVAMHWLPRSRTPALLKPLNESIMASYLYFGRSITGLEIFPSVVSFCHARPASIEPYRMLFNCSLVFDAPTNSMTVPKEILATPLRESDPQLKELMLEELKRDSLTRQPSGLRETVEQWYAQRLGHMATQTQDLLQYLHMSERTLRRRLAAEGTSLKDLKQTVRYDRAVHWLLKSDKSIAEIADLLGFKNVSCFSQSFLRWSGSSPSQYRQTVR